MGLPARESGGDSRSAVNPAAVTDILKVLAPQPRPVEISAPGDKQGRGGGFGRNRAAHGRATATDRIP